MENKVFWWIPVLAFIRDVELLHWVNQNLIPYSVPVLQIISYTTTYVSLAILFLVFIFHLVKRSKPTLQRLLVIATVLILVLIVTQGLKQFIHRERPFLSYPSIEKLSDGGDSSFPSGHTMEAFAVAMTVSLLFSKKKIIIPVYLWAILVGYSRVALGVHYPSDVLAGLMIGTSIGWIVPKVFFRPGQNDRDADKAEQGQYRNCDRRI